MPSHQATLEITLALITIENVKGFLGALESGHLWLCPLGMTSWLLEGSIPFKSHQFAAVV